MEDRKKRLAALRARAGRSQAPAEAPPEEEQVKDIDGVRPYVVAAMFRIGGCSTTSTTFDKLRPVAERFREKIETTLAGLQ